MRLRLALVTLLVLAGVAACGDDSGEAADTTTTESTTTTEATTTTAESTTTTVADDSCPDQSPIPDSVTDVVTNTVDYDGDGDGEPDTLSVFFFEDLWWVHAEWAAGGSGAVTMTDVTELGARPLGGHDIDGDGSDEAFVSVAGPASGTIIALFRTVGCGIAPVIDADSGLGFSFPVTASIGAFSGATCDGLADLDVYTGELVDADTGEYLVSAAPYTYTDGEMVAEFGDAGSIGTDELGDYSSLDCGDLAAGF